jgi:aryl-alcohol dehydrogenase-like predicted oxidoreductase
MRYQLLGRSGLRVSELCLGTMTFGEEWGWGASAAESRRIFDAFADAGGNFIDTANRYTEGTSERLVGEFVRGAGREQFVVATKYSLRTGATGQILDGGNSRRNLMQSLDGSLKRLGLDHVDLLWLHAWDGLTPVAEVMRGLDDVVRAGKVLYVGISDTPAWVVSQANTLAELRGWSPFVALQVEYSLLQRTPERDLLPMAAALGLTLTPWAPLAGGALTGKYLQGETGRVAENSARRSERATAIVGEVVAIAEELGCTAAQVALCWTMQRTQPASIPIIGARKVEQLLDSLGALDLSLSAEHLTRLHHVSQIELGFPHDFLRGEGVRDVLFGGLRDRIDG